MKDSSRVTLKNRMREGEASGENRASAGIR